MFAQFGSAYAGRQSVTVRQVTSGKARADGLDHQLLHHSFGVWGGDRRPRQKLHLVNAPQHGAHRIPPYNSGVPKRVSRPPEGLRTRNGVPTLASDSVEASPLDAYPGILLRPRADRAPLPDNRVPVEAHVQRPLHTVEHVIDRFGPQVSRTSRGADGVMRGR